MIEDELIMGNGGTPLTVADAVIRECEHNRRWLEDVIYFIQTYIDRTYTSDIVAENEDKESSSITPQQKWIPIRERLPKENTAVLVWCPTRKSIYSASLERQQWWIFGTYHNIPEVTAWMPMPEPYRGDEPDERAY